MNEIILLTGHNFMPEIHLRQPWSRYSVYGPLTKKQRKKYEKDILITTN